MTKRPRTPPTLADVAERAGVSAQTVSNYLTGRNKPRARNLQKLEAAIEALDYHPNAAARSLRSRRANALAMLLEDPEYPDSGAAGSGLREPLHMQFLDGAASMAREHGLYVMTVLTWRGETHSHASRLLREGRVDGVIFSTELMTPARATELQKLAKSERAPIVLLQERSEMPGIFTVSADDETGAAKAAQHLSGLGHSHVAVIATNPPWPGPVRRAAAFIQAAKKLGMHVDSWMADKYTIGSVRKCVADRLSRRGGVTGLFAVNDIIAMATIQQAKELGLDVPGDCSVVGFNDLEMATYFRPSITTVRMPAFAMGKKAAELVIRAMQGGTDVRSVSLPVELVVRETTGPAPKRRRGKRSRSH